MVGSPTCAVVTYAMLMITWVPDPNHTPYPTRNGTKPNDNPHYNVLSAETLFLEQMLCHQIVTGSVITPQYIKFCSQRVNFTPILLW